MSDLDFEFSCSQPITFETCASAISSVAGAPATIDVGATEGNPYDSYWRTIEIRATRANGDFVSLGFAQNMSMSSSDPRTITGTFTVRWHLPNEPVETKRQIWRALRDAFAALGCTTKTPIWLVGAER